MTYKEAYMIKCASGSTYTIQKGDNPWVIERRNNWKYGTIVDLNPGVDFKKMQVGQIINVPEAIPTTPATKLTKTTPAKKAVPSTYNTYIIQQGDNFWDLETKYKLPRGTITNLNPDIDSAKLRVGQSIKVPSNVKVVKPVEYFWEPLVKTVNEKVNPNLVLKTLPTAEQFAHALAYAETDYPRVGNAAFIRATEGNSFGYGPLQSTKRKSNDYFIRYPEDMKPHKKFYDTVMAPMYAKFDEHGRAKGKIENYDPMYDYGGTGGGLSDADKQKYLKMALTMIDIDRRETLKRLPNATPAEQLDYWVSRWRGAKRAAAPKYYDKIYRYLQTAGGMYE